MRWQRIVFSVTVTEGLLTEVSEKRKGRSRCCNPSGRRPNFIGRQHLTFDKGGIDVVLSERWYSNPSVLTAKSLQYKKGGHITSKCNNVYIKVKDMLAKNHVFRHCD